jgi:hypothetical protein
MRLSLTYCGMCFTFRFVELPFSRQLVVAGDLAVSFVAIFALVGGALDVPASMNRLHCYLLFICTTLPRRRSSSYALPDVAGLALIAFGTRIALFGDGVPH